MDLSNLKPAKGATKSRKRKGRGEGSTLGKTAGRGQNGQRSRSGGKVKLGFEGGQMPLQRRVPKLGFTNINTKVYSVVNVSALERVFADGDVVNHETMIAHGMARKNVDGIKILGKGELTKKLTVQAAKVSKSAREKIAKVGGTVEVIGG